MYVEQSSFKEDSKSFFLYDFNTKSITVALHYGEPPQYLNKHQNQDHPPPHHFDNTH